MSIQGLGADVVYECSGAGGAAQGLLQLVRRRGRYVQVGLFGKPVAWDLDQVCYKELTVTGSNASTPESWIRAIHLLSSGAVKTEPLITHDFHYRSGKPHLVRLLKKTALRRFSALILKRDEITLIFVIYRLAPVNSHTTQ